MIKHLIVASGLLGLTACATIPAPLQGNFVASTPRAAPNVGETVRWGGEVISAYLRALPQSLLR